MRKLKYLLTIGVLSTTLLFGCGSKDDDSDKKDSVSKSDVSVEEVLKNVKNAKTDVKSCGYELSINMEGSTEGENVALKGNLDGAVDTNSKKANLNLKLSANGEEIAAEAYVDFNDATNPSAYAKFNGTWIKASLSDLGISMDDLLKNVSSDDSNPVDIDKILEAVKDSSVTEKDGNYVVSGSLDMEKAINEAENVEEAKKYAEMLKDAKFDMTFEVSKDDYMFKGFEISIKDFKGTQDDKDVELKDFTMKLSVSDYNKDFNIEIPAEANDGMSIADIISAMGGMN